MPTSAIAILAAGQAQRFGSAKQLANYRGKPLLETVIDNCTAVENATVYLVLGAHREQIKARLNLQRVTILENKGWAEGIASSIRTTVQALQSQYDGILFVAGDQPLVKTEDLADLLTMGKNNPEKICCASYDNTIGIPALFPKIFYSELLALQDDRGAKRVLLDQAQNVLTLNTPGAAEDIDSLSDL